MSAVTEPAGATPRASDAGQLMQAALNAQRRTFLSELPVPARVRVDRLQRAIALLVDHGERLVDAMDADFGHRSKDMSRVTDVMSSIKPLKHAVKHVGKWMQPERRKVDFPMNLFGARAWIEFQPKGVVGVISPWNFPVNLTFTPLAGILAAGNRAMIKPSEYTPATSALMQELFAGAFDATEIAVFTGGPDVGAAFSALPFDHLLFTGATSVAHHVMRAAAENLVPVTLELGGKSPVIVSRSAALDEAADRIAMGKLMNAGQICLAPDHVFVPRDRQTEFVGAVKRATGEMYPTIAGNPDYTAVINDRHAARLRGYVDEARQRGVEVIEVMQTPENLAPEDRRMPLTLLLDPPDDLAVMQDEIFGPLLPVLSYDDVGDVIDRINARPRPLGLYYFGRDADEQAHVLANTHSGGVTLNDVVWHVAQEDLPFGGVGPSGMGAYHGSDGFREFSHTKSVFRQARVNLAKLAGMRPPYGDRLKSTLKREIRK
jgi:coniferyl-aldehyde dehydrogenase